MFNNRRSHVPDKCRLGFCYTLLAGDDVIHLDEAAIERALPLVSVGLEKYCWLQAALATTDVAHDRAFQTKFNGFYRVRRSANWQAAFYTLFEQAKSEPHCFADILRALHNATGRAEASFASKLAASIDPERPVIDFFVLKNLGLRLSRAGSVEARIARIVQLHDRISRMFSAYLNTDLGRRLITRFEESYPDRHLTPVKMLDSLARKVAAAPVRNASAKRLSSAEQSNASWPMPFPQRGRRRSRVPGVNRHHGGLSGLYWKALVASVVHQGRVPVSDRGTFGGLSQFVSQSEVLGSATGP